MPMPDTKPGTSPQIVIDRSISTNRRSIAGRFRLHRLGRLRPQPAHNLRRFERTVKLTKKLRVNESATETFGVSAWSHEVDRVGLDLVNQREIAAGVAFPVIGACAFQWVIKPLRAEGLVIGRQRLNGRGVLPSWRATLSSRPGSARLAP